MASPGRKTFSPRELMVSASALIPSVNKPPLSSILLPIPPFNWTLVRRFFNLLLSFLLHFFVLLVSRLIPHSTPSSSSSSHFSMADYSCSSSPPSSPIARALSHVLAIVSFTPVSSRKYFLARSLADRLLDENLSTSPAWELREVNRAVLSNAFAQTVRRLEEAFRATAEGPMDLIAGAISGGLKRIVAGADEGGGVGSAVTEKLGAELLWLAQKMAECGAASEAVGRWAAAEGLGRSALSAEMRTQVAFVRVSVFLFRHAHIMQAELYHKDNDEDDELVISASQCCMSMLRTWLPLLCRASTGVDMPILTGGERADMVRVLEEIIQKLDWEQQEEALALWLHHFTSCPDSDWPNLESFYTRWYAQSRKLFLHE